jgi:hypothetical protein
MIKGLIPSLMEVGKIKIGIKGTMVESSTGTEFRPPKKLDHFLITTNERDEHGDFRIDEQLMESLKKNIRAVKDANGNLTGIPVRLLYNDMDLNFPTRLAAYIGAKCVCSGDGDKAKTRDGRDVSCPCQCLEPDYQGRDKCKYNGALTCLIEGTDFFGGCHKFRTTGKNSVRNITGSMMAIQAATCGTLAFLPLLLMVQPKTTTTPDGSTTTVYVVAIVFPGGVDKLQGEALKIHRDKMEYLRNMDQIETYARNQIEYAGTGADEEEKDIAEEFYPEALKGEVVDVQTVGSEVEVEKTVMPEFQTEILGKQKEQEQPVDISQNKSGNQSKADEKNNGMIPIRMDQLKKMVVLKKDLGLDKEAWEKLLEPHKVPTAKEMTQAQADKFIAELEDKIPF